MIAYTCENCGGRFLTTRSQEDVDAEMRQLWGDLPPEDRASICEDCFVKFVAWMEKQGLT